MQRTMRNNITGLPYSLHDMQVMEMLADGNELVFKFEHGFVKLADPCIQVMGELHFHDVDWDFCYAYTLDFCGSTGPFTGCKQFLRDFIAADQSVQFEIMDETYGYNASKFAGYLFADSGLKECIIEIYHRGAMEYFTEE